MDRSGFRAFYSQYKDLISYVIDDFAEALAHPTDANTFVLRFQRVLEAAAGLTTLLEQGEWTAGQKRTLMSLYDRLDEAIRKGHTSYERMPKSR
jgi:hypothetical protein